MLLVGNGNIVTFDEKNPIIEDGAILISDNLISELGKTEILKKKYPEAQFLDTDGGLILPGLINAHTHLYSAFAVGMPFNENDSAPTNFQQILEKIWWRLDKKLTLEDVYYSALVNGINAIKRGTTCIFDHHASPYAVRHSLEQIERALKQLGLRATLCYEISDRDGEEIADAGILENQLFIEKKIKNSNSSELIKATFGLHASFTLSDKTLKKVSSLAEKIGYKSFHIHLAEDEIDQIDSQSRGYPSVVHRLAHFGLLGEKTIAAHCVYISEDDIKILKETNTIVVHNPQSNMHNAVGVAPVLKMIEEEILVGVGTDGLGNDMLTELRVLSLLHRLDKKDPTAVDINTALNLLAKNNRIIASRFYENPIGIISCGASADIVVFDYQAPTPITASNFASHIYYNLPGAMVRHVIINGEVLLKNGKFTKVDEKAIFCEARKIASALSKRLTE